MAKRQIVLDLETTGLFVSDGHRITEVGMVELIDGKPTGKTFHAYVNPERDVPEFITNLTGLTTEFLSDKPLFAEIAQDIRAFIGDDEVVITCHTKDNYTLDIAFLSKELEDAGMPPIKDSQWLNVRRWGEAMFGHKDASLDTLLDRYNIDRSERDEKGHGALLDAKLLAEVLPKLTADYSAFLKATAFGKPRKPKL